MPAIFTRIEMRKLLRRLEMSCAIPLSSCASMLCEASLLSITHNIAGLVLSLYDNRGVGLNKPENSWHFFDLRNLRMRETTNDLLLLKMTDERPKVAFISLLLFWFLLVIFCDRSVVSGSQFESGNFSLAV